MGPVLLASAIVPMILLLPLAIYLLGRLDARIVLVVG